jgi:hypothetical protein
MKISQTFEENKSDDKLDQIVNTTKIEQKLEIQSLKILFQSFATLTSHLHTPIFLVNSVV